MKITKREVIKLVACICITIILLYLTKNLTKEYILSLIINGGGSELVTLFFNMIYSLVGTFKEYNTEKNIISKWGFDSLRKNRLCVEENIVSLEIKEDMNCQLVYINGCKKKILLDDYIMAEYSSVIDDFE